jgi:hypothetical protein
MLKAKTLEFPLTGQLKSLDIEHNTSEEKIIEYTESTGASPVLQIYKVS